MSKPERPRRGTLLIASAAIAVVSYIVCAASVACGKDQPEAIAPSQEFDAQAVNDDTYAIGDASTGGGPFAPNSSATVMTSASALKPSTEPTTSAPKTTTRPRPTSGNPPPPPKSDSPPPGRHKPI